MSWKRDLLIGGGGLALAFGVPYLLKRGLGSRGVRITAVSCGPTTNKAHGEEFVVSVDIHNIGEAENTFCVEALGKDSGGTSFLNENKPLTVASGATQTVTFGPYNMRTDAALGAAGIDVNVYAKSDCSGSPIATASCPGIINVIQRIDAEITSITVS